MFKKGKLVADRNTTRVQPELSEKSMARLAALKDKTEAGSYAEVMKNALRLYEALIGEMEAGRAIYVREKNGEFTEYKIMGVENG